MELDENVDADMMDEDTIEDTMMDLHYESTESEDENLESDDENIDEDHESDHEDLESDNGNYESDSDEQLSSTGVSYEHLV